MIRVRSSSLSGIGGPYVENLHVLFPNVIRNSNTSKF